MVRIVKEDEYASRRNEILDVARQLVYTLGYEQMSIQDILDALKISKGAFYHYFDSKQALLEALAERMYDEAVQLVNPILEQPDLSALEKLARYFNTAVTWKTAQKAYLISLLRVWHADDNAIMRHKIFSKSIKNLAPLFATIIRQGILEGSLATPYPDQASELIFHLMQALSDKFAEVLLVNAHVTNETERERILQQFELVVAGYLDGLERVLCAPTGSLIFMDRATLKAWIVD